MTRPAGSAPGGPRPGQVERTASGSLAEVFDRVLDKGIIIDAWVRVSVAGIDLLTIEARVMVASIETYLEYGDLVALAGSRHRVQAPVNGPEERLAR